VPDVDAPPRGRRPFPFAGVSIAVSLAAAVFLLALQLGGVFAARRTGAAEPAGFAPGGDARSGVRVLAGEPRPGLDALLHPLREDGAPAESEEAVLDGALFTAVPRHRWWRLVLANRAREGEPARVRLGAGAVTLAGPRGPVASVALAEAFQARRGGLPAQRLLDLLLQNVHRDEVEVPPGGAVRALLAFPAGTDPSAAASAALGGEGAALRVREVTVESVREALATARIEALQPVAVDEASGRAGGARRKGGRGR